MADTQQITSPVIKSATALGAGAGSSVGALANARLDSFLPSDMAGWMALTASTLAVAYTACLMAEWWWKRVWRPILVGRGWLPKPKGTSFTVDSDGNVTRQD